MPGPDWTAELAAIAGKIDRREDELASLKAERDAMILNAREDGHAVRTIAKHSGLAFQRVSQIIARAAVVRRLDA